MPSSSSGEVTNCLGFAWMDFPQDSKALPDMRCYGLTRYGLPVNSSTNQLASLSLAHSGSLRAFGCIGSTSIVADIESPSLRYKGVAIQVHEERKPFQIFDEDETGHTFDNDEDLNEDGVFTKAWQDLTLKARAQGYDSTLVYFANRVTERSGAILSRQAEWFAKVLNNPVTFTTNVITRTREILEKANSIACRAATISSRITSAISTSLKPT